MKGSKYAMTLVMLVIFVVMVGVAYQYPPESRFMPWLVGIPAIALCLLQLFLDFRAAPRAAQATPKDTRSEIEKAQEEISRIAGRRIDFEVAHEKLPTIETAVDPAEVRRRELIVWGYFLGLVGGVVLFGFLLTIPVFIVVFLRQWARTRLAFALGLAAIACVVLYLVFVEGLRVTLHPGLITAYVLERLGG